MAFPALKIGQLVSDRTPYDKVDVDANWEAHIEQDDSGTKWYFRGIERGVGKSLRIPVLVTRMVEKVDPATSTSFYVKEVFEDFILIGYEGAGGY
jgi:hypothetical protein